MKKIAFLFMVMLISSITFGQKLKLGKQTFELHNVTGSIIRFKGSKVLKIERDLEKLPFDEKNLEKTVDDRHYARLLDLDDFENGSIEVKMYSQLQNPAPYQGIAGFIGVYFRIKEDDSAWESIYLRPKVGRVNNQMLRNHAVQYFSYPNFKFETLRKNYPAGSYEGSAPVALDEWIKMRIEVNGETAEMFINDAKYSTFVVDKMLGDSKKGFVGLYVDIGTIGYFKDLKITKKALVVKKTNESKVDGI
jgi:hypothetical protein